MTMFFAKSTNGFYSSEVNIYDTPDDAVKISDELWLSLLHGQGEGKIITSDDKGHPILVDPAPLTQAQLVLLANDKKTALMANAVIKIAPLQDAADLDIATDEETDELKAWKTYRVMLNRVNAVNAPDLTWPAEPN